MRGRKPKLAALKKAQGNPGRRKLAPEPQTAAIATGSISDVMPFVRMSEDARRAYEVVGESLRGMNFIRASDEPLLQRYAETLSRFWRVTAELDRMGGEVYECETTNGGKMLRMRPQFLVQDRLERRLQPMEASLGLTPAARQQYLLRMMSVNAQPSLPGVGPIANDKSSAVPALTTTVSPVGMLSRGPLN